MAPRLRLSHRQQQGPALGTNNATLAIPEPTDTTTLVTDPNHSGTPLITITTTPSVTATLSTSSSSPSSKNQDQGLSIPVIVGISVGTFVLLAVLLVTVMCLRSRRSPGKGKRPWKSLDSSEKGGHAPKHVSSFIGLRTSIPDPTIPNPFSANSPTSDRGVPLNSVSDNTLNQNPRVSVGRITNPHKPEVHYAEMDAHISPVSLEASRNAFSTTRNPATVMQAKVPFATKSLRPNSAASNYLNLSDDEEEQMGLSMKLPSTPLPAVLPRPSGIGVGLPSNPRAPHKPPSSILLSKENFSSSPSLTSNVASSRPAMAALITALSAVPSEDPIVPSSASSYATNFTALATPRASLRVSTAERPVTMTLDPLGEASDFEELAVTPQVNPNPNPMSTAMEAARPETLTIDPDIKDGNSLTARSDNRIMDSVSSSTSRVQARLEGPILLRPGWASASEYGYEGLGPRGSGSTFTSSGFDPSRDSLDVRGRGSETL